MNVPLRATGRPDPANAIAAADAGLRYVSDAEPGFSRVKRGGAFAYLTHAGRPVTDKATLERIRLLVIPPAWTSVWICASPRGHIQVTGRDARGRKQYRYHARWTARRGVSKFDRMIAFGHALPRIRRRANRHLRTRALSRERVLATIVRLMEKTAIRVGNEEYARTNGSYGLTTMLDRHVRVSGARVHFDFRAKSGVRQHIELDDAEVATIVKRCQGVPGESLFQYIDERGTRQQIDSADVNAYLRQLSDDDFTAKDFRTWSATVLAAVELAAAAQPTPPHSVTARKRSLNAAIGVVAAHLGNTKSVCRQCYIHPAVMDGYMAGKTIGIDAGRSARTTLARCEAAVIAFLSNASRVTRRQTPRQMLCA